MAEAGSETHPGLVLTISLLQSCGAAGHMPPGMQDRATIQGPAHSGFESVGVSGSQCGAGGRDGSCGQGVASPWEDAGGHQPMGPSVGPPGASEACEDGSTPSPRLLGLPRLQAQPEPRARGVGESPARAHGGACRPGWRGGAAGPGARSCSSVNHAVLPEQSWEWPPRPLWRHPPVWPLGGLVVTADTCTAVTLVNW